MSEKSILKNIAGFSSATLISKILGFLRDAMLVAVFGAGKLTDAYYAAFRITNLFRRTAGEGAVNASLVPILEKEKAQSEEKAAGFLSAVWTLALGISAALCVLAILFRRQLVTLTTYGFLKDIEQYNLTVALLAVLAPHIIFITAAAVLQSALNVLRKFFIPALSASVFSVFIIIYLLAIKFNFLAAFSDSQKIMGLASLAAVSGLFQCLILFPILKKSGYSPRFSNPFKHPKTRAALIMTLPAVLSLAQDQISMFINTIFASFMASGSITAIYNSARVINLPIALFAAASAQVILPELSKSSAARDKVKFSETFNLALRITSVILIPATFGIWALSLPITRTLFEHGKFTYHQSLITANTLFFLAAGLLGYGINKIANSVYYATGEIKPIIKITLFQIILNSTLCFLLSSMGTPGLTLATSISSLLSAVLYIFSINSRFEKILNKKTGLIVLKALFASLIMGAFVVSAHISLSPKLGHIAITAILTPLAAVFYFFLMKFFKAGDIFSLLWRMKGK